MIGEPIPSDNRSWRHLMWVRVTSPAPVGSTEMPAPPRPLSQYTMPEPKAGEAASPGPLHHHQRLPLAGSKLCTPSADSPIPEAMTISWDFPLVWISTGVLWAKLACGKGVCQAVEPSFLLRATSLESSLLAIAYSITTVFSYSTGLVPMVTSNV